MQSSIYLLVTFLAMLILAAFIIIHYKKNNHTELYSEGVRNENDGQYLLALHNFEDALSEVRKLRLNKKFGVKIAQRIKILRTIINYEKSFK